MTTNPPTTDLQRTRNLVQVASTAEISAEGALTAIKIRRAALENNPGIDTTELVQTEHAVRRSESPDLFRAHVHQVIDGELEPLVRDISLGHHKKLIKRCILPDNPTAPERTRRKATDKAMAEFAKIAAPYLRGTRFADTREAATSATAAAFYTYQRNQAVDSGNTHLAAEHATNAVENASSLVAQLDAQQLRTSDIPEVAAYGAKHIHSLGTTSVTTDLGH